LKVFSIYNVSNKSLSLSLLMRCLLKKNSRRVYINKGNSCKAASPCLAVVSDRRQLFRYDCTFTLFKACHLVALLWQITFFMAKLMCSIHIRENSRRPWPTIITCSAFNPVQLLLLPINIFWLICYELVDRPKKDEKKHQHGTSDQRSMVENKGQGFQFIFSW